jgi:hypothetical protein
MQRRLMQLLIGPAAIGAVAIGSVPMLATPTAYAATAPYGPTGGGGATVAPGTPALVVPPGGGTIPLNLTGLQPIETMVFTTSATGTAASIHGVGLASTGIVLDADTTITLGSGTSDASGNLSTVLTIPPGLSDGSHTITGTGNKGDTFTAAFTVEVPAATTPTTAAPGPTQPGAVPPSGSTSGGGGATTGSGGGGATTGSGGGGATLAFTGAEITATTAVGAGTIAVGGFLVLGARKRRRRVWS